MRIDITAEKLGVSVAVLKELGKNSSKAQAAALNRTLAGMRTDATRLITAQTGLKRAPVFKSFSFIKAGAQSASPSAAVVIKGSPLPAYLFAPKPGRVMSGKTRGGVSFLQNGSRTVFRHAFVALMPSGHTGVFQRSPDRMMKKRENRPAIEEVFEPSVPQIAARETVEPEVLEKAKIRFETNFQQQINRFLQSKGVK